MWCNIWGNGREGKGEEREGEGGEGGEGVTAVLVEPDVFDPHIIRVLESYIGSILTLLLIFCWRICVSLRVWCFSYTSLSLCACCVRVVCVLCT